MRNTGTMRALRAFVNNESGATSSEYALIAVLVGVAIVSGLYGVRDALNGGFGQLSSEFQAAV
jgi:pilus assembly protein Flp/PilA